MQQHKGFTLLELLVVIAIMAIVAGSSYVIAIPSIQKHRRQALCMKINQQLHTLQQQAWHTQQHLALQWQAPHLKSYAYRDGQWQHQATLPIVMPEHTQLYIQSAHTIHHRPSIVFAPNHITTPFALSLQQHETPWCHWQRRANGSLTMEQPTP